MKNNMGAFVLDLAMLESEVKNQMEKVNAEAVGAGFLYDTIGGVEVVPTDRVAQLMPWYRKALRIWNEYAAENLDGYSFWGVPLRDAYEMQIGVGEYVDKSVIRLHRDAIISAVNHLNDVPVDWELPAEISSTLWL
jgi:hypothetical protein